MSKQNGEPLVAEPINSPIPFHKKAELLAHWICFVGGVDPQTPGAHSQSGQPIPMWRAHLEKAVGILQAFDRVESGELPLDHLEFWLRVKTP